MNSTYNKLFGGFMVVLLDFNIGSFDFIPDPLGYIMIISALLTLSAETEIDAFKKATWLAYTQLILSFIEYFTPRQNLTGTMNVSPVMVLMMVGGGLISMLLVYYIYSGILDHLQRDGRSYAMEATVRGARRIYLYLHLVINGTYAVLINLSEGLRIWVMVATVVVAFVLQIRFLIHLNTMRKGEVFGVEVREM